MKPLPNRPIADTLPTLSAAGRHLVEVIVEGAERNFQRDGSLEAHLFLVKENSELTMTMLPPWQNDEDKEYIMGMVRLLQAKFPISAMIVEAWISRIQGKEWDGTRPSQDPNRSEVAVLTFFEGRRLVTFLGELQRNPNRIVKWETMYDSMFPYKDGINMSGRMVEGTSLPLEDN